MDTQNMTIPKHNFFWHIQHPWLFYVLAGLAVAIFTYGLIAHVRLWKKGTGQKYPVFSLNRFVSLLKDILSGRILKGDIPAGIMHMLILTGFMTLFAGTFLEAIDHYVIHFLQGRVYLAYSFILEVAGLMLTAGLMWAAIRRYVQRISRLENRLEDLIILLWLFTVVVSGFMVEALRLSVQRPEWGAYSFGGYFISLLFSPSYDISGFYPCLWWFHAILALGFIAVIPFCKLFHVLAAPVNIYLKDQPVHIIPPDTGDIPEITFTFHDIVSIDACTRCGRCADVCPSYGAGEPFGPRDIIADTKEELMHQHGIFLFGADNTGLDSNLLWYCTTCGACAEACPVFVSPFNLIRTMRRNEIEKGTRIPPLLAQSLEKLYRYNNPWEATKKKRAQWSKDLNVPDITKLKDSDCLCYFVGCTTSYDTRAQGLARAFVKILQHADVPFGILGKKEACCGDIARRVGEDGLFEDHMSKCLSLFRRYGIKKVVTSSPHCFYTFKNDYPAYMPFIPTDEQTDFRVFHYTQILKDIMDSGYLKLEKTVAKKVTYHDPCYLGRHSGIFETPREIISSIPGIDFVEMKHFGPDSLCCGGGGGRMWQEDLDGETKMSEIRIREAADTGAEILITACPLCLIMLEDARKTAGLEDTLTVMDINELLLMALGIEDR